MRLLCLKAHQGDRGAIVAIPINTNAIVLTYLGHALQQRLSRDRQGAGVKAHQLQSNHIRLPLDQPNTQIDGYDCAPESRAVSEGNADLVRLDDEAWFVDSLRQHMFVEMALHKMFGQITI